MLLVFSAGFLANSPPGLDVPRGWDPVSLRCGSRNRDAFGRMTGKCTEKTAPPPATPTWGMIPIQVQNRLFYGCFSRGGILQT